jgi:hypothetical protein
MFLNIHARGSKQARLRIKHIERTVVGAEERKAAAEARRARKAEKLARIAAERGRS